ncbi:MAG: protein translocase subunit SecF, partial [Fibrobacterota bacterium]
MKISSGTNIDFLGKKSACFILSSLLIVLSITSLVFKGGPNYSIDFEGGYTIQFKFSTASIEINYPKDKDISEITDIIRNTNHIRSNVPFSLIKITDVEQKGPGNAILFFDSRNETETEKIINGLKKSFASSEYEITVEEKKEVNVPSVSNIRKTVSSGDLQSPEVKTFDGNGIVISAQSFSENSDKDLMQAAIEYLKKEFPQSHIDDSSISREMVGPKIGGELRWKAMQAIFFSLVVILIYIAIRFPSWHYGLGAITALFHDVIITLGVFSVLDIEISLPIVAAFLTIVGYSLNDTIVIFDRIRENLGIIKKSDKNQIF